MCNCVQNILEEMYDKKTLGRAVQNWVQKRTDTFEVEKSFNHKKFDLK